MKYHELDKDPVGLDYKESEELEVLRDFEQIKEKIDFVKVTYWDDDIKYFNSHWWALLCEGMMNIKKTKEHGELKVEFYKKKKKKNGNRNKRKKRRR